MISANAFSYRGNLVSVYTYNILSHPDQWPIINPTRLRLHFSPVKYQRSARISSTAAYTNPPKSQAEDSLVLLNHCIKDPPVVANYSQFVSEIDEG